MPSFSQEEILVNKVLLCHLLEIVVLVYLVLKLFQLADEGAVVGKLLTGFRWRYAFCCVCFAVYCYLLVDFWKFGWLAIYCWGYRIILLLVMRIVFLERFRSNLLFMHLALIPIHFLGLFLLDSIGIKRLSHPPYFNQVLLSLVLITKTLL